MKYLAVFLFAALVGCNSTPVETECDRYERLKGYCGVLENQG